MKIKAGYKTSEFWFTLVSFIFSGLFLTGVLKENEHKEQLIEVVSHAVESVILISGQMLIFYRYIQGRNEVKRLAEKTLQENETVQPKTKTTRIKAKPKPKKNSKTKTQPKKR